MKKFIFAVMAILAVTFTACNSGTTSTDATTADSTSVDSTKCCVDSTKADSTAVLDTTK